MKRIFIAIQLLMLVCIYSTANAQWESIWPIPEHGASFLTFKKDVSLGYLYELENTQPILYQTHDSGRTWKQKRLFFTNLDNGFVGMKIMSDGQLLMVNNTKVCVLDTATLLMDTIYDYNANTQPKTNIPNVSELVFINNDTGFILTSNIFRTIDGGKTWSRIDNVFAQIYRQLHFVDNDNGYFIGLTAADNMRLYTTKDGGLSWDTIGPNLNNIGNLAIRFISNDTGFRGGEDNCLYKTTDRGQSWEKWFCLNDGKTGSNITSITFLNSNTGWATISNYDKPFKTVDGGKTFFSQPLSQPTSSYLKSVEIITPELMFITGSILYRTTNQGGSPLLSTKEIDEKKLHHQATTIYPNPALNWLGVDTKQDGEVFSVKIFDITGRLVLILNNVQDKQQLDISYLMAGTYIVKVLNGNSSSSSMLIKE